ncbi:hypothetical protein HYU12_04050 [Candidatus Woesearchaeota archaeon]|nr:hypothetical protein [Candidatus Woesearchaeota archaeon]
METETEAIGDLSLFQGRTGITVRSVLSEEDKVNSAMKVQDIIRAKVGHWNGSEEIRKWRQKS